MGLLDRAQKLAEMHAGARRSANFPQTAEELFDIIGYEPRAIQEEMDEKKLRFNCCLLYTSPSPRDRTRSRMPSSA